VEYHLGRLWQRPKKQGAAQIGKSQTFVVTPSAITRITPLHRCTEDLSILNEWSAIHEKPLRGLVYLLRKNELEADKGPPAPQPA
jgi:hypothetical protein